MGAQATLGSTILLAPPLTMAAPGRALVFGGRGLVGAAICRELARRSAAPVVSLGRSAEAAGGSVDSSVEQKSGVDALKPETYAPLLSDARAVVGRWACRHGSRTGIRP